MPVRLATSYVLPHTVQLRCNFMLASSACILEYEYLNLEHVIK